MATNLWLQEARTVIDEPGAGFAYDFGPALVATIKELLKEGVFKSTLAYYDPIGGHFMGRPVLKMAYTDAANWTLGTGAWASSTGQPLSYPDISGTYAKALMQTDSGDWTAELTVPAAWGAPFYVQIIAYEQDTASPLVFKFGKVWKLELYEGGNAVLSQRDPADDGSTTYTAKAQFNWMSADRFASEGGSPHWLWIYEVRSKLVIRNLSPSLSGENLGLVYVDNTAPAEPPPDDQSPQPTDENGDPVRHALRPGPWRAEGTGRITLGWCAQTFEVETATLEQVQHYGVGLDGSTQPAAVGIYGVSSDGTLDVTVTVLDQDDATWPQTGSAFSPAKTRLRWQAQWTSTATSSFFLAGLAIVLPRTYRSDGNSGTDVVALSAVADKAIQLSREGDLTRESLGADLFSFKLDLAAYTQANMAVRYVVDGTNIFRGLTSRAEWGIITDPAPPLIGTATPPTGRLRLQAEGLWRRFRKTLWPGGQPFDGRLLTDCLAEVLRASGLAPSGYSLAAWDLRFPSPPEGQPPGLVYRAGTPIDRILEDFSTKWYGTDYQHYFRLSDGLFVLEWLNLAATVAATFWSTNKDATAAGYPGYVTLDGSPQQTLDDSEMYNIVAVIGQAADETPLIARAIDWGSIRDRTAWNFVGEPWPLIVYDPGLATQAAVNWACRALYNRHRYPRVYVQWESRRVNLFPGQVVRLANTYPLGAVANGGVTGLYLLKGLSARQEASGDAADPWGRASYSGELIR